MTALIPLLQPFAVLAYAMLAGVFLAFSDFIMRALSRTSGHGGVEAMQHINHEVFRWVFMTLFLGMGAVSLGLLAYGTLALSGSAQVGVVTGALVYLLGCFAVTVACNVPMNEALADLDAPSDAAKAYWLDTYVPRWTVWNTVRTVACLISAISVLSGFAQA